MDCRVETRLSKLYLLAKFDEVSKTLKLQTILILHIYSRLQGVNGKWRSMYCNQTTATHQHSTTQEQQDMSNFSLHSLEIVQKSRTR